MATRKTTPTKSTWKSAAADMLDAAQSLGKAVASKAEAAKAEATTALARAKKSVEKSAAQTGKKISDSVTNTERRIEKAAADAEEVGEADDRQGRTRSAQRQGEGNEETVGHGKGVGAAHCQGR